MISIIVCSKKPASDTMHRDHCAATIGCENEYIRIDNPRGEFGLSTAYNRGVAQARGDIVVFVHEDVFFITPNWGVTLRTKFDSDPAVGLVGVAGAQYLFRDNPFWVAAGRPFIKGRVVHELDEKTCIITVFSIEKTDAEAVVADGLFFGIKRSLFSSIRFDEQTFDRFHFYDLDICMQVRKKHKIIITTDILVKHFSGGAFQNEWKAYAAKFNTKYYNELPASCSDQKPDPTHHIPFESMPLRSMLNPNSFNYINSLGKTDNKEKRIPLKPLIIVTGMHRSGTSCIAGLLHACGYSLGPEQYLLSGNKSKEDNQKGLFENGYVYLLNKKIITAAGGTWESPPPEKALMSAGEAFKKYIQKFSNEFSGELIKDPRLCLTLNSWLQYCTRTMHTILCLRHPLSVAQSLNKRNNLAMGAGLQLWYDYNLRVINSMKSHPLIVIDYDTLPKNLISDLRKILRLLDTPLQEEDINDRVTSFYEKGLDYNCVPESETEKLPVHLKELYLKLQSMAVSNLQQ